MIRSPLMNVMQAAALKAGKGLRKDFAEIASLTISRKGPGDFVSEADKRAEATLYQELSKARPGYGFLMEESGEIAGSDKTHRFIIDPLDGTTNFLHSIPHFAISIGVEREGEMVAGLIYNPMSEEMFLAEKGQGAFATGPAARDNMRLRVAQRAELVEAVIGCGTPFIKHGDANLFLRELARVMPHVAGMRVKGATALDLAFVAAGRLDALWDHSFSPWDAAAGIVIIKEAGGFVSAVDGSSNIFGTRSILAGNEAMHALLKARLAEAAQG